MTIISTAVKYYEAVIRSILEYSSQVWGPGLTCAQIDVVESIQRRALKTILPELSYSSALLATGLNTLEDRRGDACRKLFTKLRSPGHALHYLMPLKNIPKYNTRHSRPYVLPRLRNERIKRDFITNCLYMYL